MTEQFEHKTDTVLSKVVCRGCHAEGGPERGRSDTDEKTFANNPGRRKGRQWGLVKGSNSGNAKKISEQKLWKSIF